ncbi:hypothetical protein XAC2601 [Xanthomonas citri pv. citri str. 306]|uniref:Uncharacterized protein n=1 Tax=Xanthomonas axonopodis pv. citri (strain 306) TaxID=190486 RepID=A0AAI8ET67_XANAC|nr:hypothetical protein XAC2601 [Xanthomonas citri pv. citri str. 306]
MIDTGETSSNNGWLTHTLARRPDASLFVVGCESRVSVHATRGAWSASQDRLWSGAAAGDGDVSLLGSSISGKRLPDEDRLQKRHSGAMTWLNFQRMSCARNCRKQSVRVSALRPILPTCTERFDPNGRCGSKKSRRCLAGGFSSLEILRF